MRRTLFMLVFLALLVAAAPAQAGDDQIVITGDVEVPRGETVGDVFVVHGSVRIDGRVTGDIVAFDAPVRINGPVEGEVVAFTERIVIGPGGHVDGDVSYWDKSPAITVPGAVGGKTEKLDFDEFAAPLGIFAAWIAVWLAMSVSTLLLGMALLWLAPRSLEAAREVARTSTGAAIGIGLAVFFGLPAVAVLLMITLVGLPLGFALLLALLPIYAIGYTTSAFLLGRAIVKPPTGRFLAFLAGWGILRVVAIVPILGGLTWFATVVVGLGAIAVAGYRARGRATAESDAVPVASPPPAAPPVAEAGDVPGEP
jgi:cytoskeletal protein CcmA (bactofilin family)